MNIYTKKSQWDKPTEPIYPPEDAPPEGPPPTYDHGAAKPAAAEKTGLSSNNPYARGNAGSSHDLSEDERLARQLQAEENARASSRGAADSYYNQPGGSQPGYEKPGYGQPSYGQQELPPRTDDRSSKKGGFLGKLLGKASSSHSQQPQYGGYPQPGPYQAGPPQGAYGYAPQQGYYGQGGYPPQQYAQAPARTHGGLGTGGAAALGVGGGLLGGMLLADAIEDHDQGEYQQGCKESLSACFNHPLR